MARPVSLLVGVLVGFLVVRRCGVGGALGGRLFIRLIGTIRLRLVGGGLRAPPFPLLPKRLDPVPSSHRLLADAPPRERQQHADT